MHRRASLESFRAQDPDTLAPSCPEAGIEDGEALGVVVKDSESVQNHDSPLPEK